MLASALMTTEPVVIGVDGGGSHTRAICLDCKPTVLEDVGEPNVLGRFTSGPSNANAVGKEVAVRNVGEALVGCLEAGSVDPSRVRGGGGKRFLDGWIACLMDCLLGNARQVKVITLCLAGVDRPTDGEGWVDWIREECAHGTGSALQKWLDGIQISVENDAMAALSAGTAGDCEGVALISGTGTIAYAHSEATESSRWGKPWRSSG